MVSREDEKTFPSEEEIQTFSEMWASTGPINLEQFKSIIQRSRLSEYGQRYLEKMVEKSYAEGLSPEEFCIATIDELKTIFHPNTDPRKSFDRMAVEYDLQLDYICNFEDSEFEPGFYEAWEK